MTSPANVAEAGPPTATVVAAHVSEQTLDAPPIEAPSGPPRSERRSPRRAELIELAYRYRWVLTAAALLLVSLLVVLWARARPGL